VAASGTAKKWPNSLDFDKEKWELNDF